MRGGVDRERAVQVGECERQARRSHVEVARACPAAPERAAPERERLEVGLDRPRVGRGLPCQAHHRVRRIEGDRGPGQGRQVQARTASEIGDRGTGHHCGPERSDGVEEPRPTGVAPLLGACFVDLHGVAFHGLIMVVGEQRGAMLAMSLT